MCSALRRAVEVKSHSVKVEFRIARKSLSLLGSTPTTWNALFCVRVIWRNDDVLLVQLLTHRIDRPVGLPSNRVVGDDLQNQVSAASEIQAQLDVFLKSCLAGNQSRIRHDSPHADQGDGKNNNEALENTFVHVVTLWFRIPGAP